MTVSIGTTVETEATGCLRRAENETGKKTAFAAAASRTASLVSTEMDDR